MTARTVRGRIPIRLEPVPGESFDGWLDAYAQRLRMPTVELGEALGVSPELMRRLGAKVVTGPLAPDPRQIATRACGIDATQVAALSLGFARYDRLVARRFGDSGLSRALRPLAESRFCPLCLGETGGRWLTAWRLPWLLACATHHTMLESRCLRCDGTQREGRLRAQHVDELTIRCGRPSGHATGRGDNRCGYLLTTDRQSTPAPPGLIAFQAEFETVLDPALTDAAAGELVDRLIDVLVVAGHVGLDRRVIDRARSDTTSLHGDPLANAYDLLLEPLGSRLRELVNADGKSRPPALPRSWRAASPALTSVLLQHRDQRLSGSDRLRYRSMTGAGRRPERTDMAKRLRAIPTALWPDWAIRLRPIGIDPNNFRISAAAALCLPGATATPDAITNHWPRTRRAINLWRLGRLVCDDPHGNAILGAICALTDTLDRRGAPIDYSRRRVLVDQIELLDADAWVAMCLAGGMSCGRDTRLRYARLSLWETLTGGLAEQAPPSLYTNAREDYVRYDQFTLGLSHNTAQLLSQHARGLLDVHGLRSRAPHLVAPLQRRCDPQSARPRSRRSRPTAAPRAACQRNDARRCGRATRDHAAASALCRPHASHR